MSTETPSQRIGKVFEQFDRTDAPGYVVGVRHQGRLLLRRGYGMASLEQPVANGPAVRMRIGSSSKHFTALLVVMLAREGKLSLDDRVRRHVPELHESQDATLRQLMTHTSGFRCYIDLNFLTHGMGLMPKGSALETQARQRSLNYPPGHRMIYCNGGYFLLSLIAERVGGQPLQDQLKERFFEPMRMWDTEMILSDYDIHPGAASLHLKLEDGSYRRGLFPQEQLSGDGAILSTVDDMLVWLEELREPQRVLDRDLVAAACSPPTLASGLQTRYGFGLQTTRYRGLDLVHHAGAVFGGSCQMLTVPAQALDIIIMSNGGPTSPSKLAPQVIDAVLGDSLEPPAPMAPVEDYRALVGQRYFSDSGILLSFAEVEGKLGVALFGHDAVPLRMQGDAVGLEFEDLATGPFRFELPRQATQAPAQFTGAECGNQEAFRLVPPAAGEADTRRWLGEYECAELGAKATVLQVEDRLEMHLRSPGGRSDLLLTPVSPRLLQWKNKDPVIGFRGVLCSEGDSGAVKRFTLDAVRTRGLVFQRRAA
jgi:CubicO group peptidase (beta-lactamase class C family)